MTDRERVLKVFAGEPADRLAFQPRLEHWYWTNKARGTLPGKYRDTALLDLYRDLGCSIRGYDLFNPCFRSEGNPEVKVTRRTEPQGERIWWETPAGTVTAFDRRTELSHLRTEFPIKSPDDLAALEHITVRGRVTFDRARHDEWDARIGGMAAPTVYAPRAHYMQLVLDWMGLENAMYAMADAPERIDAVIAHMEAQDHAYYEAAAQSPIRIINFGDNVHCDLMSPRLFERWLLPHYRLRSAQLHAAGKYCHAHWDGAVRSILKYVRETGLDGYEALTPAPMGDVSLEQIAEALGRDLVLLDGVPCTHFLPGTPEKELIDCVERIIELFPAGNVILGVSDEVPPPGDIERVRLVAELVRGHVRPGAESL